MLLVAAAAGAAWVSAGVCKGTVPESSRSVEPAQPVPEATVTGKEDGRGEAKGKRKPGHLPVCLLPSSPARGDGSSAGPTTLLDYPSPVCSFRPVARSCQQGYK